MSIIHTVSDDDATGDVAGFYAEDREHYGYVPTRTRVMAVNPEALTAFEELTKAIAAQLSACAITVSSPWRQHARSNPTMPARSRQHGPQDHGRRPGRANRP